MQKIILIFAVAFFVSLFTFANILEAKNMDGRLSDKQQGIIPIAAFTASGNMEQLRTALNEGLDAGLAVNEIKEILVQLYAYCGFPRSLNALAVFSQTLHERAGKGIKDETGKEASPFPPAQKTSLELGTAVQTELVGAPVTGGLMDFAPAIDEFLKAHLFGDIFGRDNLDWQSRELATIAALAGMTGTGAQLNAHLGFSMNVGLTENQLENFVDVLKTKVGTREGDAAAVELKAVLKKK